MFSDLEGPLLRIYMPTPGMLGVMYGKALVLKHSHDGE